MPSAFFAGTTDPVTRKSKTRQWILEFASDELGLSLLGNQLEILEKF